MLSWRVIFIPYRMHTPRRVQNGKIIKIEIYSFLCDGQFLVMIFSENHQVHQAPVLSKPNAKLNVRHWDIKVYSNANTVNENILNSKKNIEIRY